MRASGKTKGKLVHNCQKAFKAFAKYIQPVYETLSWHWAYPDRIPTVEELELALDILLHQCLKDDGAKTSSGGLFIKVERTNGEYEALFGMQILATYLEVEEE